MEAQVRREPSRDGVWQGKTEAGSAEFQATQPGLEEAGGSDDVYAALALINQELVERGLERRDDANNT